MTASIPASGGSGVAFIHICQWPSQAQYGLTDPKSLAEYLNHANIRLVRAEYLYELLKSKSLLPRRQEAEEWGLVTHAEVKAWAAGTRDAMICSVSHAWESREHPDPCAHQLKCLVDVVSLYDAAYFSDIWLFCDFVSLFQFKRESDAEEESFRRSMQDMHVLYAHECTRTFRIESLTPDDVWEEAKNTSEYRVRVYDSERASVRDRPLKELVENRVPYGTRGWCKAEVEWSSARSHSQQNHWIDAPESQDRNEELWWLHMQEPELLGKVPMSPETFAEEMNSAAFTHRSDAEEVKKLQFKVFLQKVSECEEALFERLPGGQLGQLAKALPYFKNLRVLRLREFKVGRAEAEEFAKALASNQTIRELEIRGLRREYGFLWEAMNEALKTNSTLTSISLENNDIGVEGCKAICEALKSNSTLTSINLHGNRIDVEGCKAMGEALKCNSTLASINLADCHIGDEGAEAICEALKCNSTLTSINLEGNVIGDEGAEAICEALETNSTLTSINLADCYIGYVGAEAICEALKTNSTLTIISLAECYIDDEGGKAICEALKSNSTLTSISLENNGISKQVLAEIKTRCPPNEAPEAAKAWTGRVRIEDLVKRLNVLCNPSKLSFGSSPLDVETVQAICEALKCNSTLASINLADCQIGDEGAEVIGEALKTNSTLTSIDLKYNSIGVEGGKALAEALKSNTVCKIELYGNDIPFERQQALAEATGVRGGEAVGFVLVGFLHSGAAVEDQDFGSILDPEAAFNGFLILVPERKRRSPRNTRPGLTAEWGEGLTVYVLTEVMDESHNERAAAQETRDWDGLARVGSAETMAAAPLEPAQPPPQAAAPPEPAQPPPQVRSGVAFIHICQRPSQAQYSLTDPKSLAEYLNHANIRLVRAEYLYELLKSKSLLPRREADPCLVDVVSLFDAAYFSDVWLFYDYVSLFQFKRESDAEEESFRRSMQDMHVLYAHECTRTFRIENLTPDDVWEEATNNSEYRVRVYDSESAVVRDRPLKELAANRVLYRNRGWCKAEVEWSSARSHSQQNHWIDAPESQDRNEKWLPLHEQEPELLGKVPMAPEIFAEEMNSAAFTHRSDAEEVKKLQFKVFLQKVSECEEALFEHLPEGQLGQLAQVLPYFKKLRVLRLRDFKVGRAEAGEFAKALARNEAICELEIRGLPYSGHDYGFLWEAMSEALKTNSTLTSISFESNLIRFGVEGGKVLGEALKTNSTLTSINLEGCYIGDEGAQAICEALKTNSTLTSINLKGNDIRVEGGKAIAEALKTNSTLTSIDLANNSIGDEGAKAIAEALKTNSTLASIDLRWNNIGLEGAQALAEALKSSTTVCEILLYGSDIPSKCEQAWAVRRARAWFPKPCPPEALREATRRRPGEGPGERGTSEGSTCPTEAEVLILDPDPELVRCSRPVGQARFHVILNPKRTLNPLSLKP
ncbi:NLRC3 [Symbiodinium necroappetens]|uniref:NLRC3 protein n=1 Tax=Symbiodinium necroappetens TaxID=1628268 RepID=A0A812JTB4_9DINO|nr:NLRC3 [Symbiodinium necroappetens]